ncbi:hypothetical protein ACLOJK_003470 [Asimina triloba]
MPVFGFLKTSMLTPSCSCHQTQGVLELCSTRERLMTKDEDTIRKHVEETPTPTPTPTSSSEKSKASQPIALPKKRRRIVPTINLSQLIDKKKLSEGERVKYIRKKEKRVLKEGFVRHQGIECCCRGQIYSMSKLEEHAGKESGKSLAKFQWELAQETNTQIESEWRPAQVSPMQSCSMPKLEEHAENHRGTDSGNSHKRPILKWRVTGDLHKFHQCRVAVKLISKSSKQRVEWKKMITLCPMSKYMCVHEPSSTQEVMLLFV